MTQANSSEFAICGVTVYDGSGNTPRIADVLIKDGIIKAVEPVGTLDLTGIEQVAAKSLALAPGFIDVHEHSDTTILARPTADSMISQGVTTAVVGNCGGSRAIVESKYLDYSWNDVDSYAAAVDSCKPAINIATLCGHCTLRSMVIGNEPAEATPEQIKKMQDILAKALQQGAVGLSSGLWYIPGKFSNTEEVKALSSLLRGTQKPYATHMRSEGDQLIESVREAIEIAANGSKRLQISHIKTAKKENWYKYDALMEEIDKGREAGVQITADRYPYNYSGTGLRMCLPAPYDAISNITKHLNEHPEDKEKIVALWRNRISPAWNMIILGDCPDKAYKPFRGLTIQQIAEKLGLSPEEACLELLSTGYSSALFGQMCQENLNKFYSKPWVMPGSDGYSVGMDYDLTRVHPRSFGTFPRFFKMASQFAPYEDVVRRMSALPAAVYNLKGRGRILPGYIADLVIFDPEWMDAGEDFANPHTLSTGVLRTYVAGKLAFDRADPMNRGRFGKFVRA